LWDQFFGSAGYENAYGTYPVYSGFNIADGKVYITNDEHSPDSIPWRGGKLWCYDAYTGECLWNISGKLRHGAISDGLFTTLNSLDGQIYTFGKGPSKTTVSAPQIAVTKGTGILVTGTATDQSPGAKDTPAICDADMSAWMEYLYEQQQFPTNAKGVSVKLTAVDPNGNSQDIGTAVTDINGNYAIAWTPPVEGVYHVTVTFEGTESYYGSTQTTYFVVGPAPVVALPTAAPTIQPTVAPTAAPTATPAPTASPTVAPPPEAQPSADIYIIAAAAAVVIVVVAAAAIFLRKRK
jgi:hypothetical protein